MEKKIHHSTKHQKWDILEIPKWYMGLINGHTMVLFKMFWTCMIIIFPNVEITYFIKYYDTIPFLENYLKYGNNN